jgi:surface polysaccharide O-acyltransferase-like enzyme
VHIVGHFYYDLVYFSIYVFIGQFVRQNISDESSRSAPSLLFVLLLNFLLNVQQCEGVNAVSPCGLRDRKGNCSV